MPNLDLVSLRLLLTVAREGSMHKAAQRDGVAASVISRRISDLEHALKLRLLRRLPAGVELTPAGRLVADYATRILLQTRDLAGEIENFTGGLHGELHVAAAASAIASRFTNVLRDFVDRYPSVELDFHEMDSVPAANALRDGLIDLAVIADNVPLHNLEFEFFCKDPLWIVTATGHPLVENPGSGAPVCFADACRYDIVVVDEGAPMKDMIEQAIMEQKGDLYSLTILRRADSLRLFAEQGFGIGILHASAVIPFLGTMRIQGAPIKEQWAQRQLVVSYRSRANLAPASRLLLELLRDGAVSGLAQGA